MCLCVLLSAAAANAQDAPAVPPGEKVHASGGGDVHHVSTGERIAARLRDSGWSDRAIVASISMLPIVELRGAIPVGIKFLDMPWWEVFLIAVVGNMIPVPLIIWALGPLSRWGMRFPSGQRFFNWLFSRTRRKTAGVEKYETLGLAVFVAIPLPATGAWTGAMAAFVMGLSMRHALWSILLGVVVAGVIMTVLTWLGWIGATIFGLALLAMMVGSLQQMLKRERPESSPPAPQGGSAFS